MLQNGYFPGWGHAGIIHIDCKNTVDAFNFESMLALLEDSLLIVLQGLAIGYRTPKSHTLDAWKGRRILVGGVSPRCIFAFGPLEAWSPSSPLPC